MSPNGIKYTWTSPSTIPETDTIPSYLSLRLDPNTALFSSHYPVFQLSQETQFLKVNTAGFDADVAVPSYRWQLRGQNERGTDELPHSFMVRSDRPQARRSRLIKKDFMGTHVSKSHGKGIFAFQKSATSRCGLDFGNHLRS
jgi:hypothetical protein